MLEVHFVPRIDMLTVLQALYTFRLVLRLARQQAHPYTAGVVTSWGRCCYN
jgi:hypothetical protein